MSQDKKNIHYVHRLSFSNQERLAGAFVLLAIAALIALLMFRGTTLHLFEKRLYFVAYISNAEGLNTNTQVRISGIDVGRVRDIKLNNDNRFRIELYIYERFSGLVRADSVLSLSKLAIS